MHITEKCENWTLDFECEDLPDLETEEVEVVQGVLHTIGDAIAVLTNIPPEEIEIRKKILASISFVMMEARTAIEVAVDGTLAAIAMQEPDADGFSSKEIFGTPLRDMLLTALREDEMDIASEHFLELRGEDEDGEEKDDSDD